jgi:hypothetical protein
VSLNNFAVNATTGSLGIGLAAATTTRLLLAAGNANLSQIRLTPFTTEPTNPSDGSIWFSTSGNTLKFEKGTVATDFIFKDNNINSFSGFASILLVNTGGSITTKYLNSFGVFNALSSVTIQSTAVQTSIISSVLTGSTTLLGSTTPYNPELGVGKKYRFNAKGSINTIPSENLNIRIKLGSIVISSSSTITTSAFTYASEIEIDSTFTIRNSGLVVGSGKILFLTSPPFVTGVTIFGIYSQNASVTTTVDQIFDCTAQFGTANVGNILTINESTLEILN